MLYFRLFVCRLMIVSPVRVGRGDRRRDMDDRNCNAWAMGNAGVRRAASDTQTPVPTSIAARAAFRDGETPFRDGNAPPGARNAKATIVTWVWPKLTPRWREFWPH